MLRKNAHTPRHLLSFCGFQDHFCGYLCTFRCLFLVFWRPRHFAWTLRTRFGAFFLRLGAQGHNVMKPVSQGTFNVRFARIQGSPLGPFWMHFCSFSRFCDFAETVLPCRRERHFRGNRGSWTTSDASLRANFFYLRFGRHFLQKLADLGLPWGPFGGLGEQFFSTFEVFFQGLILEWFWRYFLEGSAAGAGSLEIWNS